MTQIRNLKIFTNEFTHSIAKNLLKLLDLVDIHCEIFKRHVNQQDVNMVSQKNDTMLFFMLPFQSINILLPENKYIFYCFEDLPFSQIESIVQHSKISFTCIKSHVNKNFVYLPPPIDEITCNKEIDILFDGPSKIYDTLSQIYTIKKINFNKIENEALKSHCILLCNPYTSFLIHKLLSVDVKIIALKCDNIECDVYNKSIHFLDRIDLDNITQILNNYLRQSSNISNFETLQILCCHFSYHVNFKNINEFSKYYDYQDIYKCLNDIRHNPKVLHRFDCYNNIGVSKNIKIYDFGNNLLKETVLIEFRKYPHLEFLLRNTIFKLSREWNHTVVCGNSNYEFMKEMCDRICECSSTKIRIIKYEFNNVDRDKYCELLMDKSFWSKFIGSYILLYQEDTILFHGNIEPFLVFDYVGAPWKKEQDDNTYHVGNGGFSLRNKKKMIEVIEKVKVNDLTYGNCTKQYMKNTNLNIPPEDVYFSKALIDRGIGKVADWDTAREFSQETIPAKNPLGAHCYWHSDGNKKIFNVYKLFDTNYYLTVTHRGGWKHVIQNLIFNDIVTDNSHNNTILLIDNVSKYFLWDKRDTIKQSWVGIVHITPQTPPYLPNIRTESLFSCNNFINSLSSCKYLITLSDYLRQELRKHVSINLKTIKHPIDLTSMPKFNIHKFKQNNNIKVVQLGQQLRYVHTIYKLRSDYEKVWMPGRTDMPFLEYLLENECGYYGVSINDAEKQSTKIVYTESFDEYDNMLLSNILVMNLINSSANNAVLELLCSNTPCFVNRLPAIEEYLGVNYPMYFTKLEEIEYYLRKENQSQLFSKIEETSIYLNDLKKSDISYDHFNSEILSLINV